MARLVTLFLGQWADAPLGVRAHQTKVFGYDGVELPTWGGHFDVIRASGPEGTEYCAGRHNLLTKYGLKVVAISAHLAGQAVCDHIREDRHKGFLDACDASLWGDGDLEGVKQRAAEFMKLTAIAARRLYETAPEETKAIWPRRPDSSPRVVVNGFTGSSIWDCAYPFPMVTPDMIQAGYDDFAYRWIPILDVFEDQGVDFALECHPGEIAFDIRSAQRAIKAVKEHKRFGFNYDPSHFVYQNVDYLGFIRKFGDRIFHVHMKDASVSPVPMPVGIFGGHVDFGDPDRSWDFRSLGHGNVRFGEVIRLLNAVGYNGPLSVEWEDSGMDQEHGAREACQFVRTVDFKASQRAFDAAFSGE